MRKKGGGHRQWQDEMDRVVKRVLARQKAKRERAMQRKPGDSAKVRMRREAEQRKARAAANRARRPSPAETRKLALPAWQVLIARMDPEAWHTFADLRALMPEYSYRTLQGYLHARIRDAGWIERAADPDYQPGRRSAVTQNQIIYRLTDKSRQKAQEWRDTLSGRV